MKLPRRYTVMGKSLLIQIKFIFTTEKLEDHWNCYKTHTMQNTEKCREKKHKYTINSEL